MTRKASWLRSALAAGALAALVIGQGSGAAAPRSRDPDVAKDLARARRATAMYQDVARAEADGYVSTVECTSSPAGAMGIHYINFDLVDDRVDVRRPEILLYLPTAEGLRLVGVEYFVPDADQDLATDDDRPFLFGRGFNGPMEGHAPGQPIHYDLHAWIWQANPAGVFEDWNPRISCPHR